MSESFDRVKALGEIPTSILPRFRFLAEADRSVIGTIHCGVLFIMAFWSGHAWVAFAELKRVMSDLDPLGHLELVVVDTDGCPDLYNFPSLPSPLSGSGEAAWIKDGVIVSTSGVGHHPECFASHTRQFLQECEPDLIP